MFYATEVFGDLDIDYSTANEVVAFYNKEDRDKWVRRTDSLSVSTRKTDRGYALEDRYSLTEEEAREIVGENINLTNPKCYITIEPQTYTEFDPIAGDFEVVIDTTMIWIIREGMEYGD